MTKITLKLPTNIEYQIKNCNKINNTLCENCKRNNQCDCYRLKVRLKEVEDEFNKKDTSK